MIRSLIAILMLLIAVPASAQNPDDGRRTAVSAAFEAARKAMTRGPATIAINDQAQLRIAEGEGFVPRKEADATMVALGNMTDDQRLGLILPLTDNVDWIVDIRWTGEGYVADDEAKDWKADDLLASLKEGNKKANAERARRGIPALNITDWIEPPAYKSTSHRLIWSLGARSANDKPSDPQTVNYNTYALGRNGYFELNLITDADHIAAKKAIAQRLIANLDYAEGKRYADFNALTDKVAAYGIAALVGGAVLKKTGLLATLAIILIKSWKAIALAMAAGGTGLWQRLRGGKGKADGGEPPVADA